MASIEISGRHFVGKICNIIYRNVFSEQDWGVFREVSLAVFKAPVDLSSVCAARGRRVAGFSHNFRDRVVDERLADVLVLEISHNALVEDHAADLAPKEDVETYLFDWFRRNNEAALPPLDSIHRSWFESV